MKLLKAIIDFYFECDKYSMDRYKEGEIEDEIQAKKSI